MNSHYNSNLRDYSKELRTQSVSRAEKYIWKALLSRKQTGYGFKRQRPIHYYIVDFFCAELGLIIEIDGSSHLFKGDYDCFRQEKLESFGYTFIRFSEGEVLNQFENVHDKILWTIKVLSERECEQ
jgi:very-short-patch-repair endonuclease